MTTVRRQQIHVETTPYYHCVSRYVRRSFSRLDALRREQLTAPSLHPFVGNPTNTIIKGIPLRLRDYLELVEWTDRQIREGKTGYITSSIPPLLERLHFEQHERLKACTRLERQRALIIEQPSRLRLPQAK